MSKPDLGRIIAQTMAKPAENRTIEAIAGGNIGRKAGRGRGHPHHWPVPH